LHARGLHHLAACDHALGVRGREPSAHQLDQQLGRKSIREHQRFGAALRRRGEQLKGAATVGLGAAATAVRAGHDGGGRWWLGTWLVALRYHARSRSGTYTKPLSS